MLNRFMAVWVVTLVLWLAWGEGLALGRPIGLKVQAIDPQTAPLAQRRVWEERSTQAAGATRFVSADEPRLSLLQWEPPLTTAGRRRLEAAGVQFIQPVPQGAWLALVPRKLDWTAQKKRSASASPWPAPCFESLALPAWKLSPQLTSRLGAGVPPKESLRCRVQLAVGADLKAVRQLLHEQSRVEYLHSQLPGLETWIVQALPAQVDFLSHCNAVVWIEPHADPVMHGERAAMASAGLIAADQQFTLPGGGAYAQWLPGTGVDGQGMIVQVMDDGLSQGDDSGAPGTAHPDIVGRIAGLDNATGDPLADSVQGHGHLNASIIMGQPLALGGLTDDDGYLLGQGIAPGAQVFATKIFNNVSVFETGGRSFESLLQTAWQAGARVSSNSWGAHAYGTYDTNSQLFDRLVRDADPGATGRQPMVCVFSAGNDGSRDQTLGSPATAKNVISVGASEHCDLGPTDGCNSDSADADDLRDIAGFSSRGPAEDGRLGPTLVATGTHVMGAASDSPDYVGRGVCGRLGVEPGEEASARRYYPPFQSSYTWSSGTSHAAPQVAGAALLWMQSYEQTHGQLPSPALVKAALVATATDPVGGSWSNGSADVAHHIPNNHAGWGRLNMGALFEHADQTFLLDQQQVLTQDAPEYSVDLHLAQSGQPLKIALAWTDPPVALAAQIALVNDLDLVLTRQDEQWLGNVMEAGESVSGGEADRLNNVECIFLSVPLAGQYTLTVRAHRLDGDALGGSGEDFEQDFALYVANAQDQSSLGRVQVDREVYRASDTVVIEVSDYDLRGSGTLLVEAAETLHGDRHAVQLQEVDPPSGVMRGQIATRPGVDAWDWDGQLSVQHGDTIVVTYHDTTSQDALTTAWAQVDARRPQLIAQQAQSGLDGLATLAVSTDEPVTLKVDYAPHGQDFSASSASILSASFASEHEQQLEDLTPCSRYDYTIQATDQAGNVALFTGPAGAAFSFQTAGTLTLLEEEFEAGWPVGWTTQTLQGEAGGWGITTSTLTRSAPHVLHAAGRDILSDTILILPPVEVDAHTRLEFWHRYDLEAAGFGKGYDGAVLEICAEGTQTWSDLGSQITLGGYDAVVQTGTGNPLAGRSAWSGKNTGTMSRVRVDLSPWAGQSVQVRLRLACDSRQSWGGWWIDDLVFFSQAACVGELPQVYFEQDSFGPQTLALVAYVSGRDYALDARGEPQGLSVALGRSQVPVAVQACSAELIDPQGLWKITLPVTPEAGGQSAWVAGALKVWTGQTLYLFLEGSWGWGQVAALNAWDQIAFDNQAPWTVSVDSTRVTQDQATVQVTCNEPVTGRLMWHEADGPASGTLAVESLANPLVFTLDELQAATVYTSMLELTDEAGNLRVEDNHGHGFSFKTLLASGWSDSLEPAPAVAWTTQTLEGSDGWQWLETPLARSAPHAWFCPAPGRALDAVLLFPAADVAPGATLRFWHTFQTEAGFDGGLLEISVDGGATWEDMGEAIVQGGYTSELAWTGDDPLVGRGVWSGGTLGPMQQVVVDLSAYEGAQRQIRLRMVCDGSVGSQGWYVDDLVLSSYETSLPLLPSAPYGPSPVDGTELVPFDTPLALSWKNSQATTPSVELYFGPSAAQMQKITQGSVSRAWVPAETLMVGTQYFWQVVSASELGASASPLWTLRTLAVSPDAVARHILGLPPLLTGHALRAVDYDADGQITAADLVGAQNRAQGE